MHPVTIKRILAVRDTRDRIEVGDRWVAVPGSGQLRPCDRCGREHEIHVDVELSDGRHANIGSGCAKGESMEVQSRLKSAVSAAQTRAKLSAELALAKEDYVKAQAAWEMVLKLPTPSPQLVEEVSDPRGMRQVWMMGDSKVWVLPGRTFDAERRQSLLNTWRNREYDKYGFDRSPHSYKNTMEDFTDRLAKIDRKLKALLF